MEPSAMSRNPTSFLGEEYSALVQSDLDWKLRVLQGPSTPWCNIDGKKVLMLCSNNYLGLTNHPKMKQAATDAIATHGAGSGSVRAIAGNLDLHVELEKRLARFKRAEASLVYQTGYAANSGLIPQLVGETDLIISDELNHGSIIDGVRLSRAERGVYKHADMADLERVLNEAERHSPPFRRILVITDGVFSMDGDIAPLDKIAKLACRARGARLRRRCPRRRRPRGRRAGDRIPLQPWEGRGPGGDGHLLQGLRSGGWPYLGVGRPRQVRVQQVADMAAERVAPSCGSCSVHRGDRRARERARSACRPSGSTRDTSRRR